MATLFVDKIDPQSGTSLTIGSSGDTVALTSGVVQSNLNYPAFFMKTTSTSISNSAMTKIPFDTATIDTDSGVDTTNNRFTE